MEKKQLAALALALTLVSAAASHLSSQPSHEFDADLLNEKHAALGNDGAPVYDIRYEVTFDRAAAPGRAIHVEMSFRSESGGPVVLSLPAWTPGSYELDNFARFVKDFSASAGSGPIRWEKTDYDTWRIHSEEAGPITVSFDYLADTLDTGMAWSEDDFAFFNGTNLFLYPEGQGLDFPASVAIRTEPEWRVATGMRQVGGGREFTADSYHDLVDMPFFVGRFDVDSTRVEDIWYRLATYPEGAVAGEERDELTRQIEAMIPPMAAVFGETPWNDYTILAVFDEGYPGGSALEHQNSHLGIYATGFVGSPILPLVLAHEVFHAWNVKRLRPEALWPYEYDRAQPTTLLWVSEGITDYYADLAMVRGGNALPDFFYQVTSQKIGQVTSGGPVALEDASLSTWIEPADGTAYVYYPKGSLAGLLLDILIRDASDNRASLDAVMRDLYQNEFKAGSGFTGEEWWAAVSRAAGGRSFDDFQARYIAGRDQYPWGEVLPLAGLRYVEEETTSPRIGVGLTPDSLGARIASVSEGSTAAAAGAEVGDVLLQVGEITVEGFDWAGRYRSRYAEEQEGSPLDIVILRDGRETILYGELRFGTSVQRRIEEIPDASPKAVRIRQGILTGEVDE